MRYAVVATTALALGGLMLAGVLHAEEPRQLGPHVHGAGTLNIAVDGQSVIMAFNAPGHDIVGFEHAPTTPEQTATLEKATAALNNPLLLFAMPPAAGCKVAKTNVTFDTGSQGDAAAGGAHKHADFDVDYELTCTAPDKLTGITFPYFETFPAGEKLTVTVVTGRGQSQFEVTKAKPALSLAGPT